MEIAVTLTPADLDAIAARIVDRIGGGPSPPAGKLLWTEPEAAAVLGISPHTLKRWRLRGYIDSATQTKPILYRRQHLEQAAEWIIQTSASQEGRDGRNLVSAT